MFLYIQVPKKAAKDSDVVFIYFFYYDFTWANR